MALYCPACHRTAQENSSVIRSDRTTCPRDFSQLVDREALDPVAQIFEGRYQTQSCLLPGEKHAIFKATDTATGATVKISILCAQDTDAARLIKFAETWSRIKHANILAITAYGASPDQKHLYVVSEYPQQAMPLTSVIDERGEIPPDLALQIFVQLCDAMQLLSRSNINHGNCMPAHLLLAQTAEAPNQVKLSCDAALPRFLRATPPEVVQELSPLYLAIELIKDGNATLTEASDIYTLGCVMYAVLTGLPPFAGKNFEEIRAKHLEEQPLSLRGVAPELDIPGMLDKITLTALKKPVSQRPASLETLKKDLLDAAQKSRIYLPTYMDAGYEAKAYTGDTGAFQKVQPEPVPEPAPAPVAPEDVPLPPETRTELEAKVKDLRSHVYLVTGIAIAVVIGLGALLTYEGPAEDRAPAWKKLIWTMDMSKGDGAMESKNMASALETYTNALEVAQDIQDGGDRKVKTLRKLRKVHEEMKDKKSAEKIREEIIHFDKQRLQADELPIH